MPRSTRDDGFSIVEIIIAMFLLMVLALALLPLLIGATQTSAVNRSLVAATAYANELLATVRADFPNDETHTCAEVETLETAGLAVTPPPSFTAAFEVGACPADLPGVIVVTVNVFETGTATPLVALPTMVLVSP